MQRLSLTLALSAVLALAVSAAFGAPPAPPTTDEIQVTVVAILASDKNKLVDDQLEDLAVEVQKWHKNLTGFRVERTTVRSLKPGSKSSFPLVEEATVSVTVGERDKEGKVRLTIRPPEAGEITYSCKCGCYFPVVTRYDTKGKERLIVAVMVRPCQLKDCKD